MTPRRITFKADLPPKEVASNAREHWAARNRAFGEYKADVQVLCLEAMGSARLRFKRARFSAAFGLRDKRPVAIRKADRRYHPADFDNAVGAVKALIDGIVLAGIIPDDSWEYLECGAIVPVFDDGPWVRVTIEEILS